jgi:CTP:molybdopterin cytidylyltransferase MocA
VAAGAGTRMGRPKALVVRDGVPWVERASRLLLAAGCERVVVVLGASAVEAATLVPRDAAISTVVNDDWRTGMASSLRAGLAASDGDGALVTLVDLPGTPVDAAARVLAAAAGPRSLVQAVYSGRPGHPVFLGAEHWAAVSAAVSGDRGARAYLEAHGAAAVECGDLGDGRDDDR